MLIYQNIDYLRINIPKNEEYLYWQKLRGFSDNSSFGQIEIFNKMWYVQYAEVNNTYLFFLHETIDKPASIQIKLLNEFKNTFEQNNIHFYGNFFFNSTYLSIKSALLSLQEYTISRLDLAVDWQGAIFDLLGSYESDEKGKILFNNVQHTYKNNKPEIVNNKLQGVYFGRKTSTNKNNFIRVYDKLADLLFKKKIDEYKQYVDYGDVTRFEVQIMIQDLIAHKIKMQDIVAFLFTKQGVINDLYAYYFKNHKTANFFTLDFQQQNTKIIKQKYIKKHNNIIDRIVKYNQKMYNLGFDVPEIIQQKLLVDTYQTAKIVFSVDF